MTALLIDGRVCTRCGERKSWSEFHAHPLGINGKQSRCKVCTNALRREHRANHPEQKRAADRRRYQRRKASRGKLASDLMRLYGLSLGEYDAMWQRQGGLCALCLRAPTGRRNASSLHVDHDHVTGRVRGLLCQHCNNGLGRFRDDPALLRRAAAYVEAA